MAKLPNRLVIEITNTDKVDELGNPVIGFESKDYAECIIEELEKIKEKMKTIHDRYKINFQGYSMSVAKECIDIIDKEIAEQKGETE